jgi:hypothetical protein
MAKEKSTRAELSEPKLDEIAGRAFSNAFMETFVYVARVNPKDHLHTATAAFLRAMRRRLAWIEMQEALRLGDRLDKRARPAASGVAHA